MKTTCIEINDIDSPVKLIQNGVDRFEVHYGLQIFKDLNYTEAATELGKCIMHALACASRLDNRTKKEAREENLANYEEKDLVEKLILAGFCSARSVKGGIRLNHSEARHDAKIIFEGTDWQNGELRVFPKLGSRDNHTALVEKYAKAIDVLNQLNAEDSKHAH